MQSIRRPHRAVIDKNQPSRLVVQAIKEMIAKLSGPVADIGCGSGRNALAFVDAGCAVYCLDNNAKATSSISALQPNRGKLIPLTIDPCVDA
jgi:predicted RNA methylase